MNKPTKRFWVVLAICAGFTLVGLIGSVQYSRFQEAELYTEDLRARFGRTTPVDSQLVLIGIDRPIFEPSHFDETELQQVPALGHLFESYPWSREVWAELIGRLARAGAKSIIVDIVFASSREGDNALREVIDKYGDRIVVGYQISESKGDRGGFTSLQLPNTSVISPLTNIHPAQDSRLGYVTIWPDSDGVFRGANYRLTGDQVGNILPPDFVLESLESRALQQIGRPDLIPAGFQTRLLRYTAPPGMGYKPHPLGDVISPKLWERNYAGGQFFKDKIVLIGPTAEILQDAHLIPLRASRSGTGQEVVLNKMPGPEIHLNILNAALHNEFLSRPSRFTTLAIVALGGILAGVLSFLIRQPVRQVTAIIIICVGYWFLAQFLFNRSGWIVPVAVPLLLLVVSSVAILTYDFVLERLERMKLRHTMGLYFSPRVLEAVLADPGSMKPRRAEVTMLLTDLRNSTPLAEALGPQGMFELLNQVFQVQTSAIMSEEGNLEHFLGDQFLSYWGAPQSQPDAADRAERAAVTLIRAMEALRATLPEPVAKLFGYGVALHSGNVLVGNKGSALRLDYGLVGDAVNEAARIEALTKYYGIRLLISRETFSRLSEQSSRQRRLVDRVIVKGKSEPVELFECENPCTPPNYSELCRRYKAAYDEYFFGHFAEAQNQFDKLVDEFADGASRTLAARCAQLAASPPVDWTGTWKMEAK